MNDTAEFFRTQLQFEIDVVGVPTGMYAGNLSGGHGCGGEFVGSGLQGQPLCRPGLRGSSCTMNNLKAC